MTCFGLVEFFCTKSEHVYVIMLNEWAYIPNYYVHNQSMYMYVIILNEWAYIPNYYGRPFCNLIEQQTTIYKSQPKHLLENVRLACLLSAT